MPSLASGKPRPIGVPGLTLCRKNHPASWRSPHNVIPGSLGERLEVSSPGYEAGRRRTIGVVAALQSTTHATTPMVRRWTAGTPMRHSGPEGRGRGQDPRQRQKSATGTATGTGTGTATGFSDRQQRPATDAPSLDPMPSLAGEEQRGKRKTPPHRGAGFDIVPGRPSGFVALPAQCHTGLPRRAPRGQLSRLRSRPALKNPNTERSCAPVTDGYRPPHSRPPSHSPRSHRPRWRRRPGGRPLRRVRWPRPTPPSPG